MLLLFDQVIILQNDRKCTSKIQTEASLAPVWV